MSSAEFEELRSRIALVEHQMRAIDQRTRTMLESMAQIEDRIGEIRVDMDRCNPVTNTL